MLSHLSRTLSVNISDMLCGTKDGSGENFVICWETANIIIVSWVSKTHPTRFTYTSAQTP